MLMKSILPITLVSLLAGAFASAGDDLHLASLTESSDSDSLDSVMAPSSLGKAVIESNYKKSRNLFLEATGGWVFAVGDGELTSSVNKTLDKSIFGGKGYKSSADIHGRSIDDIYDAGNSFSLRVGLNLGSTFSTTGKNPLFSEQNNGRVYLRFSRTEFDGNLTPLGYIDDCTLTGDFHDYQDWGIALGYERDFGMGRLRPFVGFEAGVRFVDEIGVNFIAEEGHHGSTYNNVNLYDDSVALGLLFSFGIDYDITHNFTLGIESGIAYQTGLDENDSDLADFELEELNDAEGNFWSVPVLVTGRINF